jgi:hypothetical protein
VLSVGDENTITDAPGKEDGGYTEPTAAQLTCAGTLGCHGNHDSGAGSSISGFHHATNPGYRFLRFYDGSTHTNIKGKGSDDWEKTNVGDNNHNVYYAMDDDSSTTKDSISVFCSLCHGDFHDQDDTEVSANVWKRHPTEVLIPTAWDAGSEKVTVDYERNPFAFTGTDYDNVNTNSAYDMTDNPRVACISCHRAHATDQPDILRFAYSDMEAGGGNTWGCLGCHTGQR